MIASAALGNILDISSTKICWNTIRSVFVGSRFRIFFAQSLTKRGAAQQWHLQVAEIMINNDDDDDDVSSTLKHPASQIS